MLNFIAIHLQRTLDIQDYASLSFFETQCYTTAMQVMRTTTILHYFMRSSCSSFKTSCFLLRSVLAASDPFCNIQHHSITLRLHLNYNHHVTYVTDKNTNNTPKTDHKVLSSKCVPNDISMLPAF